MVIKKVDDKFVIFSESGKKLDGPFDTEAEAKKRLSQIEHFKKQDKEHRFASGGVMEVKSVDGELVIGGYIATTHPDSYNDIITKEALDIWEKEINDGIPRANKVTYHHDRQDKRRVGVGLKGSARVDTFPDGEYGLFVNTVVNKSHDLYDDIEYEYRINVLDSFSIEFVHPEPKDDGDMTPRVLGPETELYGWTLASSPVNDNAVMIKEMLTSNSNSQSLSSKEQGNEEYTMSEENTKALESLQAELKELKEFKEQKEAADVAAKKASEADKKKAEEEEAKKKMDTKEKELNDQIVSLKEAVAKMSESNTPALEDKEKEDKIRPEFKELSKTFEKKDISYKSMCYDIGKYLAARGFEDKESMKQLANTKENGNFDFAGKFSFNKVEGKETMEFKGLSVGDNVNTNYINATTEIGLSQAELQDVMLPVIFNALNESTVTWDLLAKDNMGSRGTNRITFVLKTGNTGAYFSKGNAITTTETDREKYTIEYKKIYIGGAVDGDLQAYSRGAPFGEALALEIADRTIALKTKMNQALFDETAGNKSAATPLGIPAITDSAGNTTLYDTTRSAANKLDPDAAGDTYVDGSGGLTEPMLRNAIEQATTDGSDLNNLIFVGTPAVINKYKALFDNKERLVPYSPRAGYKNAPDFEGVPLFGDKDSKASSLFLIDTAALRIGILVPSTVEMLGKRSDSSEFFVKSYYAVYCTAPRRLVEIYSIA